MKHTLPLLALVAAASAQTAPASGLNYDLLTISRHQRQNTVAIQATLKDTNFVVGAVTSNNNENDAPDSQINVGYIFKNVTNGIDATIGVSQTSFDATVYTVVLRRQWNEVYQGLEIAVGYAGTLSSQQGSDFSFGGTNGDNAQTLTYVELAYNVNKTFAVAVGLVKPDSEASYQDRATVFSVRAGF
jgi:hypothetical protein